MLQVKNISKSYVTTGFTQVALDDVSISFRDNEFAAILGPSGSGKTTLLNIIGGLDRYDSGDLIIDGISTKDYKASDWDTFRNNRIGFVFQSYNLISHQTVLKNVELALTLSGVGKEERQRRATEVLERVGLKDHIYKKPNQLSGGQMQRVAIARALINDPEILLADEPTGALDSQTSVEVMDLLQEIANDRLVIMVTHNPELAEKYANRIVTLRDGKIQGDTNAYEPTKEEIDGVVGKKARKASMSFLTALELSFNNLMSKKGRTIMTAFAGSIGIIGIAAILSLSNGVNRYIHDVEEDTLTSYPISISKSGFDLSSLVTVGTDFVGNGSGSVSSSDGDVMNTVVGETEVVNNMVSKMSNNDLTSLKSYIESDEGKSVRDNSSYIKYDYNIQPIIYVKGPEDSDYRQANPDDSLSALGMGSSSYTNSTMSSMMTTNVFQPLIDQSLVEDSYDLKAGHWPTNKNECVLVLSESGNLLDYTLYQLGFRDYQEYKDMVQSVIEEKDAKVEKDENTHTYRDLMNSEMKVVVGADRYQKDSSYDVWVDKSGDKEYIDNLINTKSETLKISGIVQVKEGSKSAVLTPGVIYYTNDLILDTIDKASKTQIVKEQLADKNIDVFSGKEFSDTDKTSGFDTSELITVDEGAIQAAFKFDPTSLNLSLQSISTNFSASDIGAALPAIDEKEIQQILGGSVDISAVQSAISTYSVKLLNGYSAWVGSGHSGTVEDYMQTPEAQGYYAECMGEIAQSMGSSTQKVSEALSSYMNQYMNQAMNAVSAAISRSMQSSMSQIQNVLANNIANSISIDQDAFANAFKFNMTPEEMQGAILALISGGTDSAESNLQQLGYADLNTPTSIDIYAKDFDTKQAVKDNLDDYSKQMRDSGHDDKAVSYTDIVGVMMSGVRTIINVISYLLIAFVSISLIVSSIMIGIITYVSVLERTKEIGILRSIGASRKNISQVFNAETILEGLIAGVMGIVVTALLCIPASAIVKALTGVPNIASLPFSAAIILICISVFLTFIAGLIPAASASRKDPVIALRTE